MYIKHNSILLHFWKDLQKWKLENKMPSFKESPIVFFVFSMFHEMRRMTMAHPVYQISAIKGSYYHN